MPHLDRRTFLIGTSTVVLAAACGGDADGAPIAFLVPTFPDGFRQASVLVAGRPQRLAFVVRDEIDILRDNAPTSLAIQVTNGDTVVFDDAVEQRVDGIITPYYAVPLTFDAPGEYVATLVDHPDVAPIPFLVVDAAEVAIPQVGDTIAPMPTPTVDDALGVEPICTRAVPCELHQVSFADVAANGRPTALLIATPGFCQTDICGPVVDLLIDAAGGRDDIDVIHAEVYVDPSVFASGDFPDVTPIVSALALPFEPALFVLDGGGVVRARLDTTFDRSELADALSLV